MNILFVCTGNICRSPMAQQMLRQSLDVAGVAGIQVTSAGVMAMAGHDLDSIVADSMRGLGFDPAPHAARQLTAELVQHADLILTATTRHRTDVVELHIPANRYTFTLKEFAAVAEYVVSSGDKTPGESLEQLLEDTKLLRGYGAAVENPDIADPYKGTVALSNQVAAETKTAVEWVAKWLS